MIQTNCGVDIIYIANGNDLGEADLYCHQLIFYLNQILRKEERGKGRERGKEGKRSGENIRKYFFFSTLNIKSQNKVEESSLLMHIFMKSVQNF